MKASDNQRRPIIGIMTGYILSDYSSDYNVRLVNSICREIEQIGIVAKIYTTVEGSPIHEALATDEEQLSMHWVAGIDYCRFDNLLAIVLVYSTIIHGRSSQEIRSFLDSLPDIPIIIVGNRSVELRNGRYIVIDGYQGMKEIVNHLIEVHHLKKIAMVSGSRTSKSAISRLQAYKDALAEHGIPIKEDWIVYGSYFHTPDSTIDQIFQADASVEAIVAAADEMCNGIYRVAESHGRIVGKDLAVVGYDNIATAKYMDPPLSTVDANIETLGASIADMIKEQLDTGEMISRVIPSTPLIRCSCGCSQRKNTSHKDAYGVYISRDQIADMEQRDFSSALMLRSLLLTSKDPVSFFEKMGENLHHIGTHASYILMHENPVKVNDNHFLPMSQTMRLIMIQKESNVHAFAKNDAPVIHWGEAPLYADKNDEEGIRMEFLLFCGNYRYGVLCVFAKVEQSSMYRTLSLQIGSAIRYHILSMQQKALNRELEEQNQILDFSATHDGLTGLYNRVGFMKHAIEMIRRSPDGSTFVAMMADVDHLKQINDNLGHAAGDLSITTAASILHKCIPNGIVGRTGGDEFTAIFPCKSADEKNSITQSIKQSCENYNNDNNPGFYLGISLGCSIFPKKDATPLAQLIEAADEELYENKKLRRQYVIREEAK